MNMITQGLGPDETYNAPDPNGTFLPKEPIMPPSPPSLIGSFLIPAPIRVPAAPEDGQFG